MSCPVQICAEEESAEAADALRAIWLQTGRAKDAADAERLLRRDLLEKRCAGACIAIALAPVLTRDNCFKQCLHMTWEYLCTTLLMMCMPSMPRASPCACCFWLLMALLWCAHRAQKLRRDIQKRETDMAVTLDELRVGASG
jgi:hypothetical protein